MKVCKVSPIHARCICPAVLVLSAMSALAAPCAAPRDLAGGIRVEYADGAGIEVRQADVGVIELREIGRAAGGGDLRFLAAYGLYDLEVGAFRDGQVPLDQRVSYVYEPAPLTAPQAGAAGWTGTVTAAFPGGVTDAQTAAYLFGAEQDVELGDCFYRTVTVEATFIRADGWEGQRFLYFADLGFAVLIGRSDGAAGQRDFALRSLSPLGS